MKLKKMDISQACMDPKGLTIYLPMDAITAIFIKLSKIPCA